MLPPLAATGQAAAEGSPTTCALYAADLANIELMLSTILNCGAQAGKLGAELALAGGKRLRPRLCLLAYRICAETPFPPPQVYRAAAALELLHLATLVHDDVLDSAEVRRARPSLNATYGNRPAVLVGDYFFSQFLKVAAPLGARNLALLAGTISAMVEGELEQARHQFDPDLAEEDYFAIINKKTAALLATSCLLGARGARAGRRAEAALERFGRYLGCAFQIQDDILDYVGNPAVLGKPRGGDLAQGVVTLPLIYALRKSTRAEFLRRLLVSGRLGTSELNEIRTEVEESGGIAYARAQVTEHLERALAELHNLPDSAGRHELETLTRSLGQRER